MKPDYAFWERETAYKLWDAMHLCVDLEPPSSLGGELLSRKVRAMGQTLAVEVPYTETNHANKSEAYFKQSDLREWAERTGRRVATPFLFPEDRAESAGTIGAVRGLPRLGGAMPSLEASRKSVIVTVAGREAIPVRALTFVTGRSLSPDAVAQEMAERKEARKLTKGLRAYQLHDDGTPVEMLPKEWDLVDNNLKALSARLNAAGMSREESHAFWRRDSILCLPPGVFLWRDEFDGAFFGGAIWTIMDEREGDREWIAAPLIPNELHEAVMEGFEPATNRPQDSTDKAPLASEEAASNGRSDARESGVSPTAYRVIRALALALADACPEKLKKDGRAFIGYAKNTGNAGIVGHLVEGGHTNLKTTALEEHLGRALKGD